MCRMASMRKRQGADQQLAKYALQKISVRLGWSAMRQIVQKRPLSSAGPAPTYRFCKKAQTLRLQQRLRQGPWQGPQERPQQRAPQLQVKHALMKRKGVLILALRNPWVRAW